MGQLVRIEAEAAYVFQRVIDADTAQQPDRYQVAGFGQCVAQSRGSEELPGIVFRPPGTLQAGVVEHHGRVIDQAGGGEAFFQRGGIDEGFETGARLAQRLGHPVELAGVIVVAAHQRQHGAVLRSQGYEGAGNARHLAQMPVGIAFVIVSLAHVHDVPDLEYVGRFFGRLSDMECVYKGSGPLQSLPGDLSVAALAQVDRCRLVLHGGHQGGMQFSAFGVLLQQGIALRRFRHCLDMAYGAAVTVAFRIRTQGPAQGRVGCGLGLAVDRGVNLEAAGIGLFAVAFDHLAAHHLGHVGRFDLDIGGVLLGGDRRLDCLGVFLGGDVAELQHASQHIVAAGEGAGRVGQRVVCGRGLGQPGNHRDFGQAEFSQGLAVIDPGGGADTVGAVTQVDLVEIQRKDLFLAELLFDIDRQKDLIQLAQVGLFPGQVEVACHLHGDSAAPLFSFACKRKGDAGAQESAYIDTGVSEEGGILGGGNRLHQSLGQLFIAHRSAALFAEFSDQFVVCTVDL